MTLEQLVNKYNLKKQNTNIFGDEIDYNLFKGEKDFYDTLYYITLENEMSHDLDNGTIYFLTIQTIYKDQLKYDSALKSYMPKSTITTKKYIFEEKENEDNAYLGL